MNSILILFLVVATYTDIKETKIKNNVTYPLILIGLITSTYIFGLNGFLSSLGGITISLLVVSLIPGFRHGGGDIKLAMGISSFLGMSKIMYFLFIWFLLSILICNIKLIRSKGIRNFKNTLLNEILTLGEIEEDIERTLGAPIILAAYIITIICFKGWSSGWIMFS